MVSPLLKLAFVFSPPFLARVDQDFDLDGGGEGYPLTPAHADLRDIEITARSDNLDEFYRQDIDVDLSRSVW